MKITLTSLILFSGMIMSTNAQYQSYEVDDNGCVAYGEGDTDNNCKYASGLGLFNGNIYSHSYECTKGLGYACCESTNEYQSNVQNLGQCVRNECNLNHNPTYTPECRSGFSCQVGAPGSNAGICVANPSTPQPTASPTPAPNPRPTSQDPSYEVDDNGCVSYNEGDTDNKCKNASELELFDGNYFSHSYKCTEGVGYACCASTNEYQSNVQDLGQCTRNYQEDDQGCIPDSGCNSDDCCANENGFSGHNFSYACTKGEKYACCNSNKSENLSNVQDLGQCQRNTSGGRNLRRRI